MNAPLRPIASRSPLRRLAWPLVFLLVLSLIAIVITGFFRLSRDARCLRNSLKLAADAQALQWDRKLELSFGALTFRVLQAGLAFAPLNPDARAAVQSVRGAEVGIYKLHGKADLLDPFAMLAAADTAMEARGWDRLVGVANDRELVAVYVPGSTPAKGNLQACLAVMQEEQMVVVSASSNVEQFLELALHQIDTRNAFRRPVRL
jgi:hypothetical protein